MKEGDLPGSSKQVIISGSHLQMSSVISVHKWKKDENNEIKEIIGTKASCISFGHSVHDMNAPQSRLVQTGAHCWYTTSANANVGAVLTTWLWAWVVWFGQLTIFNFWWIHLMCTVHQSLASLHSSPKTIRTSPMNSHSVSFTPLSVKNKNFIQLAVADASQLWDLD